MAMTAATTDPMQSRPTSKGAQEPLYVLDSSKGLGSNQIHRLASDRHGCLWMATPVGLFKWDANFVSHWGRNRGLKCNGLRSVCIDTQDRVWVGTDLGLEVLDLSGKPRPELDTLGWQFGLCQHIVPVGNQLWLGTGQGLVKLLETPDNKGFALEYFADVGFVSQVMCLDNRRVLAATSTFGLIETDGKTWWPYRCEAIRDHKVTHVAGGLHGRLLIGTQVGLFVLDDAHARPLAQMAQHHQSSTVTAMAVGVNQYWVAFGRCLSFFGAGRDEPVELGRYRVESSVNDLWIDALDNVWVATNNSGLCVVSCLSHAIERVDVGHPGGIYAIRPGQLDHYMLGGESLFGGTVLRDDDVVAALHEPAGLPKTTIWDTMVDESGTWAATQVGLYHAPNQTGFSPLFAQHDVLGAPCRVVLSRGAETWVGSLSGLACILDGKPRVVLGECAPLGYVYAMTLDDLGVLWVGTLGRGLWCEHNGLHALNTWPLAADGNTYAMAQGPGGDMAIVQDEKVVLLDRHGSARLMVALPPLAGWAVHWLDGHTIALGASDGLRVVDVPSGRVTQHVQALLPLRDWEFTCSRALTVDSAARVLCGLSSGLVRVDLAKLNAYAPPVCKLGEVTWRGVTPGGQGQTLQVMPGRWTFHVRAFSAWFVDAAQVRFEFQLVGFDPDWCTPLDRPEISYTSLPPGSYRLLARAYAPLTGYGPECELLRLQVKRPFWGMGWTHALATLEAQYDRVVRSRTRNQALIETNRQLELAVADRTALLQIANQALAATRDDYQRLSEVDPLTQLGNRRRFDMEMGRYSAMAGRLNVPLALMIVDIDHFKAVNDQYGHPVGDEYLRAVGRVLGQSMRTGQDVATRFGGEEFTVLLMDTDESAAFGLAEQIRAGIADLRLPNAGTTKGYLTVSVGLAASLVHRWLEPADLLAQADHALYQAKRQGRDQVVVACRLT